MAPEKVFFGASENYFGVCFSRAKFQKKIQNGIFCKSTFLIDVGRGSDLIFFVAIKELAITLLMLQLWLTQIVVKVWCDQNRNKLKLRDLSLIHI